MKKLTMIMCVIGFVATANAQQTNTNNTTNKRPATDQPPVTLRSTGNYTAKAPDSANRLFIADPVIRAFNMRSNGANIRLSGSGVLGAPRGTYGFANGQISLRTTDATSIGGITGNGSVGTGSTMGGVGTAGLSPLVNGKNVYAGPSIWGSARNLMVSDSLMRQRPGN